MNIPGFTATAALKATRAVVARAGATTASIASVEAAFAFPRNVHHLPLPPLPPDIFGACVSDCVQRHGEVARAMCMTDCSRFL